ncbi:MAG: N-6 DNA methylase [Coriobacteriales bacterium]
MNTIEQEKDSIEDMIWETRRMFRKVFDTREDIVSPNLAAYAAWLIAKNDRGSGQSFENFETTIKRHVNNPVLQEYLLNELGEYWQRLANGLLERYSTDMLEGYIINYESSELLEKSGDTFNTPDTINRLAYAVLNIQDNDKVADLGCGCGNFLAHVARYAPNAELYGVDTNKKAACLTIAKLDLLGAKSSVEIGDMFENAHAKRFDKVFSNFPFGVRPAFMHGSGEYYDALKHGRDGIGRPSSGDWLFNKLAYDSLNEGGSAVTIMTNGATFNGGDKQARRYFVDNGMIKAVVALPAKLFPTTSIPSTLIVLGKNDGPVRMVDATDLSVPGRRWDTMGSEEITILLERLEHDSNYSKLINREELASTDYNIYPMRYLGRNIDLINPAYLKELALSIERGASLTAKELDELTIESDSCLSYLRLSDINDGRIENDLPRLRELDCETKKQWLKDGDLIVSKNAPFKIAVAEVPKGKTILATGNMYIIRFDTEQVDPYFVAAYLTSEDGKEMMERMVVGTVISNLPLKNLREIQIPVPDMHTQKSVAQRYQACLDEIEVLKIKIDKARIGVTSAYDEAMKN